VQRNNIVFIQNRVVKGGLLEANRQSETTSELQVWAGATTVSHWQNGQGSARLSNVGETPTCFEQNDGQPVFIGFSGWPFPLPSLPKAKIGHASEKADTAEQPL
jgi:hypothetical protein